MADFLASFNLGGDDAAQPPSACASIEDLQLRLQDLLVQKTTATRAEHVAANLEIAANALLTVGLSPAENGVLEGLNNLDPSLGGLHSSSIEADGNGEQMMRSIRVIDTLKNQPSDEPVLQRAVANHIVSTVSNTDGSSWAIHDMSFVDRGWNFVYLCMESSQQWDLVNKGKTKSVIGDYTLKEPDPTLMSRPAFDCRGSVRVSFPRDSRSILVKYDHTPFHKTVAEVAEYHKPPPRQVVVPSAQKQKTPKKQASLRKKRDSTKALGENGKPRKRKKTEAQAAQPQEPGVAAPYEQQPLAELGQNGQASVGATEGGFVDGLASGTAPTEGEQSPQQAPASQAIPLNLSPEETARRRDVATKLLSEAGVGPDTLSTEQFNIFANQSPELQKESLNMLVKYGAERLRIVHPSNRDSSASAPPSTIATPAQATMPVPLEPLATTEAPSYAGKAANNTTPIKKSRTPGKSRKACTQCKERKLKCPRERPTCAECQTQGLTCEYAPPKPRMKKPKSSEAFAPAEYDVEDQSQMQPGPPEVTLENGEEPVEDSHMTEAGDEGVKADEAEIPGGEEAQYEDALGEEAQQEEEINDAASSAHEGNQQDDTSYSAYPQVPVSDMLAPSVDIPPHHSTPTPYFRSASGLALPQPEEPQQMHAADEELMMAQGTTVHYEPHITTDTLSSNQNAENPIDLLVSPTQQSKGARRSLPTGPLQRLGHDEAPAAVAGWSGVANSTIPPSSATRHNEADASGSRGLDHRLAANSPQMQDVMALSQAALRQTHNMPAAMQPSHRSTLSHPANDSRMKSRLGQRPQQQQEQQQQQTTTTTARGGMHAAADGFPSSMSNASNNRYRPSGPAFHTFGAYSDELPNQSADRIGYEPYSFQRNNQTTPSFSAYDYGRHQPTSTMPVEESAMTAVTPSYPPNNLGLSDSNNMSASRGHGSVPSRTTSPYDPPGARRQASQSSASGQDSSNHALRAGVPRPRSVNSHDQQQPSHSHGHYHQHQPKPQSNHHHQQQSHSQSLHQGQQGWYGSSINNSHSRSHNHHHHQNATNAATAATATSTPSTGTGTGTGTGTNNANHNHNNSSSSTGSSSAYPFGLQRSNYSFRMPEEPWGGGVP
ncbi:hypothetical protein XA68_17964 [Ophiocordyceps unilateralis]|uniref:Zn(2)-C6 fungal-type domain-containing protein n=1 Tax=Ophiocordyceps unilateralis TaxID=268505 RepID=A0A2A9PIJ8_OPHUN|nr:hypothetical protein XA68_17964 [Ophiocordyceps unilateralis]